MDKKTKTAIENALRKVNRNTWKPRKDAKAKCKVDAALFRCSKCGVLIYEGKSAVNYFDYQEQYHPEEVRMERFDMDHILPVVDPHTGFTNWQDYIERMFCPEENWRGLCSTVCHASKTKAENQIRLANKYGKKTKEKN